MIKNEIMKAIAQTELSGQEARILLYQISKDNEYTPLSEFAKILNTTRFRISEVLKKLIQRNMISVIENHNSIGKSYAFNVNYNEWLLPLRKTVTSNKNYLIKYYIDFFIEKYGVRPFIGGKEQGVAKRMGAIDDIKELLMKFFESNDKFIIRSRHSLNVFESVINRLRVGEIDKFSGLKDFLND